VAMLSSVLRSPRALAVNIEIMRAFVRLRRMFATNADLAQRLDELERRYDAQFRGVFDAIRDLMTPLRIPVKTATDSGIKADSLSERSDAVIDGLRKCPEWVKRYCVVLSQSESRFRSGRRCFCSLSLPPIYGVTQSLPRRRQGSHSTSPSGGRRVPPLSSMRWALWNKRSRMASATVGLPMVSCHSFEWN